MGQRQVLSRQLCLGLASLDGSRCVSCPFPLLDFSRVSLVCVSVVSVGFFLQDGVASPKLTLLPFSALFKTAHGRV